jgi:hypothetical protein
MELGRRVAATAVRSCSPVRNRKAMKNGERADAPI